MPKKNTLFLDCNSGISGDMFVAALIDLGADVNKLMESLNSLGLDGVTPEIGKVNKNGISATDFSVINTNHAHEHRGLKRIQSIIDASSLSNNAKNIALRIFDILAEAEATVHGMSKDKIHFHEVGAWDSIMDIAAIAHCVDALGIGEVYATTLTEGSDCHPWPVL